MENKLTINRLLESALYLGFYIEKTKLKMLTLTTINNTELIIIGRPRNNHSVALLH